ncbi:MAG: tetratricopeptide repeat protein, partial [Pirellulales bacterium]
LEPARFPQLGLVPGAAAEFEFWRGVAYRRAGILDKAIVCLDRAQQLGWSKTDVRREKVLVLFQSGRVDQAAPQVEELLAEPMDNETAEEVYDCLVLGYLSEYRLHDARTCMEYWLEWQPHSVAARLRRAEMFGFVEDPKRQEEDLREILKFAPETVEAHFKLAETLLSQRRVTDALAEYRWCAAREPESGSALLGVGSCLRQIGNLPEARRALDAGLKCKLKPTEEAYGLAEQAEIDLVEKKNADALAALTRAVELDPHDGKYRYALGSALSKAGRRDLAERQIEEWRKLDKHKSRLYDLEHEIIAHPRDADLRCEIGVLLREQGLEKESYAWLTSALRCDPNHRGT